MPTCPRHVRNTCRNTSATQPREHSRFTPLFTPFLKALESLPFRSERAYDAYLRYWEAWLHYSNTHVNNGIMREVRIFFSSDAPKACKTAKSHDIPRDPQEGFAVPWAAVRASSPTCIMPPLPPLSELHITRALHVQRSLSAARSLHRAAHSNPYACGARTCGTLIASCLGSTGSM
jgi:hypothetical protein